MMLEISCFWPVTVDDQFIAYWCPFLIYRVVDDLPVPSVHHLRPQSVSVRGL